MEHFYILRHVEFKEEEISYEVPYEQRTDDTFRCKRASKSAQIAGACLDYAVCEAVARSRYESYSVEKREGPLGRREFVFSDEWGNSSTIFEMPVIEDEDGDFVTDGDNVHGHLYAVLFSARDAHSRDEHGFVKTTFFVDAAYTTLSAAKNAVSRAFIFSGGETPEALLSTPKKTAYTRMWEYHGRIGNDAEEYDFSAEIIEFSYDD